MCENACEGQWSSMRSIPQGLSTLGLGARSLTGLELAESAELAVSYRVPPLHLTSARAANSCHNAQTAYTGIAPAPVPCAGALALRS